MKKKTVKTINPKKKSKRNYSHILMRVWWLYLFIGGLACGHMTGVYDMQKQAIEQGLAHYGSTDGQWAWGVSTGIIIDDKMPDIIVQPKKETKHGKR